MIERRNVSLLVMAATLNLSACAYIQSLFPDKEKDYQYTTEIPPLVLPNDLRSDEAAKADEEPALLGTEPVKEQSQLPETEKPAEKTTEESSITESAETEESSGQAEQSEMESDTVETEKSAPQAPTETKPEVKEDKMDVKQENTPVELVRFSDGERRLRIASSPERAWRLVSKALSRNSIEVTQRDQDQKLFYIQYDPDARKAEDGSLVNEVIFLFKGFEANEKEYLLILVPVDDKTDLAVTDKELNPVSDDATEKLLRLLGGTIQGN